MPVHNADAIAIFEEMADRLDIEGANPFRVRAYHNAARTIDKLSQPVADMVEAEDDLSALPGIGNDLASKIQEIVETGKLKELDALENQTTPRLADLLRIPGLGPKRVRGLHEALGIATRDDLRAAARAGQIRHVSGFGITLEQNILDRLVDTDEERRWFLASVEPVAQSLAAHMEAHTAAEAVTVAGSYRRRKETVGDLDVLVQSTDGSAITDHFVAYEDVDAVTQQGSTRASVVLRTGLHVDLRVVTAESYGAALHYFTGSKAHNVALWDRAMERGLKLNEYGVFRTNEKEEQVAGATEEEVYEVFGLPYIVAELREMRGELEAASRGALPDLVTHDDLRGNLHTHTTDSDGRASIQAMVEGARP